jgi:hypothetical protein
MGFVKFILVGSSRNAEDLFRLVFRRIRALINLSWSPPVQQFAANSQLYNLCENGDNLEDS